MMEKRESLLKVALITCIRIVIASIRSTPTMPTSSARNAIRSSRRAALVKQTDHHSLYRRNRAVLGFHHHPQPTSPSRDGALITSRQISPSSPHVHDNFKSLVASFSSNSTTNTILPKIPNRPWLDRKLPLDVRVNKFVEVDMGQLGAHAVRFDAVALADVCCRSSGFGGMKLAHDILDRSLAEKRHFDLKIANHESNHGKQTPLLFEVPLQLFKTILFGWCNLTTKGRVAQVRMRELVNILLEVVKHDDKILKQRQEHKQSTGSDINTDKQVPRLLPNTDLFNTYLLGLKNASRKSPEAASSVIAVLDEMEGFNEHRGWHTKPNTKSYTLVIDTLANSGQGPKAEKVLRRLIRAHETEKQLYMEQYGVPYNTVDRSQNKRRIPTPDVVAYTSVIRAYSRSQGHSASSVKKAKDLLIEYMGLRDESTQPDALLFTTVIAAHAKAAENRGISEEARFAAAKDAEELLEMMLVDFKSTGGTLNHVEPYNACLNAYAKCGSPQAVVRSEKMLQTLLSDYAAGNSTVAPNTVTFNTALSSWARCADRVPEAPEKAEELLHLQLELVESNVLQERADSQSFTAVMVAYAKSNDKAKVQNTYRLLKTMLAGIADGTVSRGANLVVPFTTVLNAAAFSKPASSPASDACKNPADGTTETSGFDTSQSTADDIYTIALQTYRELKEDAFRIGCKPDHMAFAAMLEVLNTHTHPSSIERRQMSQLVFEDASSAGEVSKLVLKALFRVAPDKELIGSLLQSKELANGMQSVDELPRAWTRNVGPKFRHLKNALSRGKNTGDKRS